MTRLYVRLKRKNQTIFLKVESSTKIIDIKKDVAKIVNHNAQKIGIITPLQEEQTILPDDSTIGSWSIGAQKTPEDDILYFVYNTIDDKYESINITDTINTKNTETKS